MRSPQTDYRRPPTWDSVAPAIRQRQRQCPENSCRTGRFPFPSGCPSLCESARLSSPCIVRASSSPNVFSQMATARRKRGSASAGLRHCIESSADETIRDYAELARLGRVTRARMTQIVKLLHLAPDIQEQILFLPRIKGLNERNLRRIVSRIDWDEQRRMFWKITGKTRDNGSGTLKTRHRLSRSRTSMFPIHVHASPLRAADRNTECRRCSYASGQPSALGEWVSIQHRRRAASS